MSEELIFTVPNQVAKRTLINNDQYLEMYKASTDNPEVFWEEHGKRIDWIKPYSKIKDVDFTKNVNMLQSTAGPFGHSDPNIKSKPVCGPRT